MRDLEQAARMIYILINLVPILLATAAGLAIGYGWLRIGRQRRVVRAPLIVLAALGEGWFAAILAGALILAPPRADPWIMAIGSAVVIWAGFVAPAIAISLTAAGSRRRVVIGAVLHWLAVMVAQAVVLKLYGLVPPPGA